MADIQHSAITDPYVHEPKGASTAGNGTVYVSDGSGSGSWTVVGVGGIDYDGLVAELEGDIVSGDFEVSGSRYITVTIPDISTASSVLIPVPFSATVEGAEVVLGGTITAADASISFSNSSGAGMGTAVTVVESGSAKGDQYTFTATGNNTLVGPTYIEVATDGASTGAVPVYVTVSFSGALN